MTIKFNLLKLLSKIHILLFCSLLFLFCFDIFLHHKLKGISQNIALYKLLLGL